MTKKCLTQHLWYLLIPIFSLFCVGIFLVCLILNLTEILILKEGEFIKLVLIIVITDVTGCTLSALIGLTFVNFTEDKIYYSNYTLLGIPRKKQFEIKEITHVEISYGKAKLIELYRNTKKLFIMDIRDKTLELILEFIPLSVITVDTQCPKKITEKQLAMLEPLMSERQKKEMRHYEK